MNGTTMDLGTILSVVTIALLLVELSVLGSVLALMRRIGHNPGAHLVSVLTRTVALVVVAQVLEVASDLVIDSLDQSEIIVGLLLLRLASVGIIFMAIGWAWWDLTALDRRR